MIQFNVGLSLLPHGNILHDTFGLKMRKSSIILTLFKHRIFDLWKPCYSMSQCVVMIFNKIHIYVPVTEIQFKSKKWKILKISSLTLYHLSLIKVHRNEINSSWRFIMGHFTSLHHSELTKNTSHYFSTL